MSWEYGGLVEHIVEDKKVVDISIVFSWLLDKAYQKCIWYREQGYEVYVGGPAVDINPSYLSDVAIVGLQINDFISLHNLYATFTSRGCIRNCKFCIVPKLEGKLEELEDWPVRPVVCDNNFLATSEKHFNKAIDKLKHLKQIDFNQGLDARLITKYQANRLAELDMKVVRLAWDHTSMEKQFMRAFNILIDAGFPAKHIRCYVLMGFNDTPDDALYRLETIKGLGAMPNPMRYQPIDTPKKNSYVGDNWTDAELKRYMRYWSRQVWLGHIPFEDYVG